jgi:glutamine amidotransferase
VPHLGWNRLQWQAPGDDRGETYVYFAHSFHVVGAAARDIEATAQLEDATIVAACRRGRVGGCQFHPEKSGAVGLRLLQRWLSC